MPEEEKKTVDIDTSGPETEVDIPEEKDESVVDTAPKEETKEEETGKEETVKEETKKEEDSKLEDYSKGVQARIAKLTRKMREAERREQAAVEYANALEKKRKLDNERFQRIDSDYTKKFEENVKSSMESAQKELAMAIEAQDANAQVNANKRIAALALENARLEQQKSTMANARMPASEGGDIDKPIPRRTEPEVPSDPKAEAWAAKNTWFGTDRAMTYTAFEIHKDLTEKEGFDPHSDEYYEEVNKRMKVDFPHKFDNSGDKPTTKTVQSVASAKRTTKTGRKQVRLTSSQVAIAKKLGVPLEEYAKQLKLTEGA
tara:strand:- start:176 stop:1126 length:951 start_codon:yes stop_codon:yes gene_type:complete